MTTPLGSRSLAIALSLLLVTTALAGCLGTMGDDEFASFQDARQQVHTTLAPEEDLPLRLGLIEPNTTSQAMQGEQNVTFVLWDQDADEPVRDAEVTIEAFMPMMGHGTSPETDPVHLDHGVYRGTTNLMMGGDWLVHLNATLPSGDVAHFPVELGVAGDGPDMDPDMGDDMDGGPSTNYDSYEDAKAADGETFEPEANTSYRLKLLEPDSREGLPQGATNVTLLFYDSASDEPVTNGSASLEATMPAMGHGADPETDPVHAEHGVWKGSTTLAMNGTWELSIELDPADEDPVAWTIEVVVGEPEEDTEPPFEPYEEVFEDEMESLSYEETHLLEVAGANATLTMNATLQGASPLLDELTVTLLDPEGDELGSVTLDADTNASSITIEQAPAQGDYEIQAQGQALDASYRIVVHVAPP